jgi:hypothetical protein
MDRAQELTFTWALADSAAECMLAPARARLCVKIGAGEQKSAIVDLLAFYAEGRAELPYELAAPIRAWIKGYAGTDTETMLLSLYDRIRVSVLPQRTGHESAAAGRLVAAHTSGRSTRTGSSRQATLKRAVGQ